ncbi:MAG: hypothetical protein PQJ59_00905 [Spirochaetales bacterium]|nr:hypothetical protein [Spirochaetales bacterium]
MIMGGLSLKEARLAGLVEGDLPGGEEFFRRLEGIYIAEGF